MKLIDRLSNAPADKLSWEIRIQVLTDPLKVPYAGKRNYVDEAKALARAVLGIDIEADNGHHLFWGTGSVRSYEEEGFTLPAGSSLEIYNAEGDDIKVSDWAPLCGKLKGHYDFLRASEQVESYDAYFRLGEVEVYVTADFAFYK